jgi:hypothetical protein
MTQKPQPIKQDPSKYFELMDAMTTVHILCRELELPEIVDIDAARTVIMACMQRGPESVKRTIASAFEGTDSIN